MASGIRLLSANEYNPFKPYFWYSEVIIKTVDKVAQNIYLTFEGSANLDGEFWIQKAIVANFLHELGQDIEMNQLLDICSVTALNFDRLKKDLHHISFKIIVGVENTLCGNDGMVRIYDPQKGFHFMNCKYLKIYSTLGNLLTTASTQHNFDLKGGVASGDVTAAIVAFI